MQEDKRLKGYLVLQSFCPLFVLIFIQHIGHDDLVIDFIGALFQGNQAEIMRVFRSSTLGDVIITFFAIVWFVMTIIVSIGFHNIQSSDYDHHGETITIHTEKKDSGVTYLVTFVLPLLVEDVSTIRGFFFFKVMLWMVIFLLIRSDLFYQNPVLVALRFRAYEFTFNNPYSDVYGKKTYIGLSKGYLPIEKVAIKRKYISDDVFLIYNE